MRCLDPRTVGFQDDGKTICWSQKSYSKEFATFQLPCGQCIECRLEYARQWAVRCVHESSLFDSNCFITLTYSDDQLGDGRLDYGHFQKFVKDLRNSIFSDFLQDLFGDVPQRLKRKWFREFPKERRDELYGARKIGVFVTGEYGDLTKRPHWHALIFNWRPTDSVYKYSSDRGDRVYSSEFLSSLWGRGIAEFGDVTFHSAGYVARYAAKKLIHGDDGHEFEPVSKKSSHQAIGKRWLEKYWRDVFSYGHVILPDGSQCSIPRYYEKWLKDNQPEAWLRYVTEVKLARMAKATLREEQYKQDLLLHNDLTGRHVIPRAKVRKVIIDERFSRLQACLKGDF